MMIYKVIYFRKSIYILLMLVFLHGFLKGNTVIKNPDRPLSKDAGGLLKLEEEMRIIDNSENFYLKYPSKIKISTDGSIFILDEKQLLKFDVNGKFVANFYKHGQGPQEVISISDYLLLGEELVLHDSAQNKIIFFNHKTGNFLKEFKLKLTGYNLLFHFHDEHLYFLNKKTPDSNGKLEILDVEMNLISVTTDGKHIERKFGFPTQYLILRAGNHHFSSKWAKFLSSPSGNDQLYVSHTSTYEIKLYSFKTNSIVRTFTRDYKRIKVSRETEKYAPGGNYGKISIGGNQMYKVPKAVYHRDIQQLFCFQGQLWVITSTVVGKTKVLVDVYNNNGLYIDNFYLDCPPGVIPFSIEGWIKAIDDYSIYALENDDEGQIFLKVYKLVIKDKGC